MNLGLLAVSWDGLYYMTYMCIIAFMIHMGHNPSSLEFTKYVGSYVSDQIILCQKLHTLHEIIVS